MKKVFDCIVVGGGHAGTEAALASARMGCRVLLLSMNLDTLGFMSCNPAIGGVGKGQLVKEIDALGGEMAKAADKTAIQFRRLNSSKGAAARSSRCQSDRQAYRLYIKATLERQKGLHLRQAEVTQIIVKGNEVKGVKTRTQGEFLGKTVIITPGTFLNGLIHIGLTHFPGGRLSEHASIQLAENLRRIGFPFKRFKTGTCPRLDGRTINFNRLHVQKPDEEIIPFSFSTKELNIKQIPCSITFTNRKTHQIILSGLDRSPLFTGVIKSTGVRYCPSIEDKVVRFSERQRHQIFLEPEGTDTVEVYPNGLATSLPLDIQIKMLHSIRGLEDVEIMRPGYGIEHDLVDSTCLYPTLETRLVRNLYLAGQINGTTGYEEAAAQGLVAGINAALRVKDKEPLVLKRWESYIGVLVDDLVTKGTNEPYRMFTSRVEYRLLLREDNADLRLQEIGYKLGLVSDKVYKECQRKKRQIRQELERLRKTRIRPGTGINKRLKSLGSSEIKRPHSLDEILRRPEIDYQALSRLNYSGKRLPIDVLRQIEIEVKYSGFIDRQLCEVERFRNLEKIRLPGDFDFSVVPGLSREIVEKLTRLAPLNLGQASRISGVTPAAISILMVYLKKLRTKQTARHKKTMGCSSG
jgi:tRNA uridine 5-carboxymethylaminomethyl modification enzyme